MTQVGQYAYLPKRFDEQVVWHHLRVTIYILSRVIVEKWIVTSFDLRWPSREPHHHLNPYHHGWGEEQPWGVAMIELGGLGWFMQNGKHLNIFPYAYNGKVTSLTWPSVARIKILRHTFDGYWWPRAILSRTDPTWTVAKACLLFLFGESADLTWWPGLTLGLKFYRMFAMNIP